MGAPITYQLDGRQYISLMGGQGVQERYGIRANEPPQKPTASTVYPKVLTYVLDRNASQEAAK
jgi:hypothetical protein